MGYRLHSCPEAPGKAGTRKTEEFLAARKRKYEMPKYMGRFAQQNNEVGLKGDEPKVVGIKEHLCMFFISPSFTEGKLEWWRVDRQRSFQSCSR